MSGRGAIADALSSVARGAASFELHAELEQRLLNLLKERGTEGVSKFLRSLPGYDFKLDGGLRDYENRFVSPVSEGQRVVVTTFLSPHFVSVDVGVEDAAESEPTPDPRHQIFYHLWEELLGLSDSEVAALDSQRKAVFLVGLLEAETMNGGLGQYLSNSDGIHVKATLECLTDIGASRTAAILARAAKLAEKEASFTAAWDSHAPAFQSLDEEFLACGEDLAGLTIMALFE